MRERGIVVNLIAKKVAVADVAPVLLEYVEVIFGGLSDDKRFWKRKPLWPMKAKQMYF